MISRLLLLLVVAMPRVVLRADSPEHDAGEAIRAAGRAWLATNDGVGLSIGIYENNRRHFYNFGAVQLDGNRVPTKDTIYEIGGISKVFTGQLLARAIVEGRAALEDDVDKYLEEDYPNLGSGGERIRLRHLVSNTSHLLDNIPDLTQVRSVRGQPLAATHIGVIEKYTLPEFLFQLHRVAPARTPGSMPASSNVAAMLLGVALERIHEQPFAEILAREIERPLRMASGTAPPAGRLARGHTANNEPLPPFGARMQYASSTLRYSADDLLKFCTWQMLEQGASVKLAHQPTWSTPSGSVSLGFFWVMGDSSYGRRLATTGATFGFASLCDLYPDQKIAVVVLANKYADGAQDALSALSAKIVELLRSDSRPAGGG